MPAVSKIDGEFDSFALARSDYAVEDFAERFEDLFAKHVHSVAAEVIRVGSIREALAGASHTQKCAVIQFEQRLVELFYQRRQRARCRRQGRLRSVTVSCRQARDYSRRCECAFWREVLRIREIDVSSRLGVSARAPQEHIQAPSMSQTRSRTAKPYGDAAECEEPGIPVSTRVTLLSC